MGRERELVVTRLGELDEALAKAVAELQSSRANNRKLRKRLEGGESIQAALPTSGVPGGVQRIGSALKQLEEARHKTRTAIFALGLQEGLSIGELGRMYGFSRQLAQRFAKEAREIWG
jgi:hypothetical protein